MNVVEFITHDIKGIILLNTLIGVVGSMVGTFLYKLLKERIKRKQTIKNLVRAGTYFGAGCRTEYAMHNSSFHQVLLVGDYLKDIIISGIKVLLCCILATGLLALFHDGFIVSIIIAIASVFCGLEYRRLRDYIVIYRQIFKHVYGDAYFESEIDGIKHYWVEKKD